jgi:MFS family permease
VFWIYLAAAALAGAGFADFPLIAYHFQRAGAVSADLTPVFYAVAMAVSGTGSLLLGRIFDRVGISVLVPLTLVSAAYAPLVFLGGFWAVLAGSALWGLGMGVQESIIPAAVAPMVSPDRRAYAYGLFTSAYGTAWVVGSIVIGVLIGTSLGGLVAFCVIIELAAIPLILAVRSRKGRGRHALTPRRSARRRRQTVAAQRRPRPDCQMPARHRGRANPSTPGRRGLVPGSSRLLARWPARSPPDTGGWPRRARQWSA